MGFLRWGTNERPLATKLTAFCPLSDLVHIKGRRKQSGCPEDSKSLVLKIPGVAAHEWWQPRVNGGGIHEYLF